MKEPTLNGCRILRLKTVGMPHAALVELRWRVLLEVARLNFIPPVTPNRFLANQPPAEVTQACAFLKRVGVVREGTRDAAVWRQLAEARAEVQAEIMHYNGGQC